MTQMNYKSSLNHQASEGHDMRMGSYKLTEIEKRLNRNVLDDGRQSHLMHGANQILKPTQ